MKKNEVTVWSWRGGSFVDQSEMLALIMWSMKYDMTRISRLLDSRLDECHAVDTGHHSWHLVAVVRPWF
jgi:hypothetical protein